MGAALGRHACFSKARNQPVTDVSQLPAGDIHIRRIDLTAGVMQPIELRKLEGLTHLRELYLPGPIWNPGGGNEDKTGVFKAWQRNRRGETRLRMALQRDRWRVGDDDIKRAVRLDGLKICAVRNAACPN